MIYMNRFRLDMNVLLEEGKCKEHKPSYLLFDYQKRNPLDHAAAVIEVPDSALVETGVKSASPCESAVGLR